MLEPHDVKILAVTRSGRDGTLPGRADRRDLGRGGPLRDRAPATDGTRHLIGAPELG